MEELEPLNLPPLAPLCITWLYRDVHSEIGVSTVGRSCPFIGTLDECVVAVESEIQSVIGGVISLNAVAAEQWVPLCDQPRCDRLVEQKDIYGGFHCRAHGTVGFRKAFVKTARQRGLAL